MNKKKRIIGATIVIIILILCVLFLWPRSFADVSRAVESIAVVVVEESFDHDNATYIYDKKDSEFKEIMKILNQYSYHLSLRTISNYLSDNVSLGGNKAGYWLNIYLYTEPDRQGECYDILSGGTGDIIVNNGVYRIGYWGNDTALNMMDEVCQTVNP